ncbi:integrase core domain-containing protein [Nocardia thraciensis]
MVYTPSGTGGPTVSSSRSTGDHRSNTSTRNHWTSLLKAQMVIGDFKTEHNHRRWHSVLGYLTPAGDAVTCSHTDHA